MGYCLTLSRRSYRGTVTALRYPAAYELPTNVRFRDMPFCTANVPLMTDPDIATVTFGTWHDAIAQLFQRP